MGSRSVLKIFNDFLHLVHILAPILTTFCTILKDLRAPGTHFGDPGPHFGDFSDFCDFEDICQRKCTSVLTSKCGHKSTFCNRIFLMFFERSVLEIFGDFLHLRAHFGSHFNDFL